MNPVLRTALFLSFAAVAAAQSADFPNAGFEEGLSAWSADRNDKSLGLSQASAAAARTGGSGLRVVQKEGGAGSWLQSPRIAVEAGKTYRIAFWARLVESGGIGVWIQFLDGNRTPLKPAGGDVSVQLPPEPSGWKSYSKDVAIPPDAAWITLAVHGYNKRAVLADFDDFSVTRADSAPATATTSAATPNPLAPDADRVERIASWLPERAKGIGPDLSDRAAWDRLGAGTDFREKTVARAERFAGEPSPEITAEMWENALKTRDRKIDALFDRRRFRLVTFVLAEGVENRGRFLAAAENEIAAICAETSWILSGHVQFTHGRNDLGTAMTAWNLAAADTLLGDRLAPATRRIIREKVRERVLSHYLAAVRGETKPEWWSTDANNWNAVVHGGVVGSALALLDDRRERAEIVAGAERGIAFYLRGFPSDGYSPEGLGYWKYGFGHYVLLAEAVLDATGGRLNLYDGRVRLVAQFPRRFAMAPDVYPAYGDNQFLEPTSRWIAHVLDRRFGLGDGAPRASVLDPMYSAFLYAYGANLAFDSSAAPMAAGGADVVRGHRPRDWFPDAQVYVGRPAEGADAVAVSFKGGNNGVSHCHTDLGGFSVVLGGVPVIADPGVTVYDGQTFGPDRYKNPVVNSYGHNVPLVAGVIQKEGREYSASVVETAFADGEDRVVLDLAKGYPAPALSSLTRSFAYRRSGAGAFTVTDRVAFSSPQPFGVALVTYGTAREEKPGVWLVTYKDRTLRAAITTEGDAPFAVTDEILAKPSRIGPVRRLGINLVQPAASSVITVTITPASP